MNAIRAVFDLPETHTRALAWLLDHIPPGEFLWVLTGSGSLRINGVDLPVHDLDIKTDLQTISSIEKRLGDRMTKAVRPWESPRLRSLDGKAEIDGVQVELVANFSCKLPDGSWATFNDFSRTIWVEMQGLHIPTLPLESELEAYIAMGRLEIANLIRKTIGSHSELKAAR